MRSSARGAPRSRRTERLRCGAAHGDESSRRAAPHWRRLARPKSRRWAHPDAACRDLDARSDCAAAQLMEMNHLDELRRTGGGSRGPSRGDALIRTRCAATWGADLGRRTEEAAESRPVRSKFRRSPLGDSRSATARALLLRSLSRPPPLLRTDLRRGTKEVVVTHGPWGPTGWSWPPESRPARAVRSTQ